MTPFLQPQIPAKARLVTTWTVHTYVQQGALAAAYVMGADARLRDEAHHVGERLLALLGDGFEHGSELIGGGWWHGVDPFVPTTILSDGNGLVKVAFGDADAATPEATPVAWSRFTAGTSDGGPNGPTQVRRFRDGLSGRRASSNQVAPYEWTAVRLFCRQVMESRAELASGIAVWHISRNRRH